MKTTSLSLCLVALVSLLQVSCMGIKGNGNETEKIIEISSYDKVVITANGSMDFEYEQSDAAPFLSITIDENLFEYLNITDKNGTLTVGVKENNFEKVNLNPTVFKIKSSSKDLKEVSFSGVGNFNVDKPFSTNSLKLDVSGVANINFKDLDVEDLTCNISGVGNIELAGKAAKASYSSSGVGNINAYECRAERAKVSVSGVGHIYLYSSSDLDISCSGLGDVKYKGGPDNLNISKSGIGSISAVD